jgi:predicted DsbA family dithiol-disulfide isomerase
MIEAFADVVCPFTHVGLRRIAAERDARGRSDMALVCRAWPLELVNGAPLDPDLVAAEITALRASVAPDLFAGFDPARFPRTSIPALSLADAAYRAGTATGERLSLALRSALFEEGRDLEDPEVLDRLATGVGLGPEVVTGAFADGGAAVRADWREGSERGVLGSPHFFVDGAGMFCPTLRIAHDDRGFTVELDEAGYEDFVARCFG